MREARHCSSATAPLVTTTSIALIPNGLPVLVYFGILGLSGTQLNASTGLVATIVLGIAVDYYNSLNGHKVAVTR